MPKSCVPKPLPLAGVTFPGWPAGMRFHQMQCSQPSGAAGGMCGGGSGDQTVPVFCPFLYRYRNLVKRFFNKINRSRAVATRYDKPPENFPAGVKLASTRTWMRLNESKI